MNKKFECIKKICTYIAFGLICVAMLVFGGTFCASKNYCHKQITVVNDYVYADDGVRIPPDSPTEKKEKLDDGVNVQNVFIICIVVFLVVNASIVVTINVIKDRKHKAIFEKLERERLEIENGDSNLDNKQN